MSRYAANCKWCGERPGGCLYCVDENADNDEEKYLLIKQMIDRGEVHVLAIRHTEEVLLRQAGSGSQLVGAAGVEPRRASRPLQPRCTNHSWAHDGVCFKYRYCTRPGCGVRQKFVWLPDDANVCGKWIDITAVAVVEKKPQRRSVRKTRAKQTA